MCWPTRTLSWTSASTDQKSITARVRRATSARVFDSSAICGCNFSRKSVYSLMAPGRDPGVILRCIRMKAERQQEEFHMKKKTNVRRMTELALLTAIVLIMAFTPLGYLKTPWGVEITFIVIPVAVGAVILGPWAGAFLGLVFGLTSFAQCFSSAMGMIFLEESPLGTVFVCVVNRVLVGLIPGLLYQVLKKFDKTKVVGIAVCCLVTPVLNTVLYIVGNWLIFSDTWMGMDLGYSGNGGFSLLLFMLGMVAVNGIAEALSTTLIGTAVCKALQKTVNKQEVRVAG